MKEVKNKSTEVGDENEVHPTEAVVVARKYTSSKNSVAVIVSAAILVCFIAGVAGAKIYGLLTQNNDISQHQSVVNDGNKPVTQQEATIANVVDKVAPSVVSVLTTSQQAGSSVGDTQAQEGAGTGIIISKDGYILTNKHVIDGATSVSVVLSDGTSYDNVQVIGSDPLNDVAFLKIPNASNLTPAALGDSSTIRVGQSVIAIGNSLGQYRNTVTSGIISGIGRPISAQAGSTVENLSDLIQTDAAINPGNSGGPLLNIAGQVIGINTAIIQNAQGIGFSIPIDATKGIMKGVLAGKGVRRAFLGVDYIPITADVAKHYGLPVKKGGYVFSDNGSSVVSGGPADKAGIQDKDIIVNIGNIAVGDKGDVSSLVAEYAPGDTVQVTVLRNGKTINLNVTLVAYSS